MDELLPEEYRKTGFFPGELKMSTVALVLQNCTLCLRWEMMTFLMCPLRDVSSHVYVSTQRQKSTTSAPTAQEGMLQLQIVSALVAH